MVKRPKLSLVFDEEKRKEYLTGFRKRKLERKFKAKQQAEERLKQEIQAVKSKYREAARKRLENVTLPVFLEDSLKTVKSRVKQVIDDHTVTIEEIDIANSHYFMGSNRAVDEDLKSSVQDSEVEKMSLKKALKMNPTKIKRGWHHRKSKKSKNVAHKESRRRKQR